MKEKQKKKAEVITQFQRHPSDTASPEVQVALLTSRINHLIQHFKEHKKDHSGHRGLLKMVADRKKLLKYLLRTDIGRFRTVKKELGIR